MSRSGSKPTKAVTRRCIATQEELPKVEMIRFVLDPNAQVTPDVVQKLPGRGMWVSAKHDALRSAIAKNAFKRAAKSSKVKLPDDLEDMVQTLLCNQLINLIALARKSGCALQGFETVKTALAQNKVQLLLQASDGSQRQSAKLRAPKTVSTVTVLNQGELGLAFARDYVIHAALTGGGLFERIEYEAKRLAGLRFYEKSC